MHRPFDMTQMTNAALTRRRFLLVAAAAGGLVAVAGCGSDQGAAGSDAGTTPPVTEPSDAATSQSPTAPTTSSATAAPGSTPGAAPVALRGNGARREPGDPQVAATALAGFGADFLRTARALDAAAVNTAISPYSLYTVLAMARAGAKGDTADQLDTALRAKGVDAQGAVITAVDDGVAAALTAAKKAATDDAEPMVIQPANQAWVQNGFEVHQEYLDTLAVQYGIEAMGADFAAGPEKMRAAINTWVADRTNDLIPELFPQGSIDESTVIVLVNALYLKAPWANPFVKGQPAAFHTDDGEVQAPMMKGHDPVRGATGEGWTAVTIPYLGGMLTMTVLVPDKGKFDAVLKTLDGTAMVTAAGTKKSVMLTMPMFDISTTTAAQQVAEKLGITDIFQPDAVDLSGIAGVRGDLYAQSLLHQCVVKVDEKGTEAAAATGLSMGTTAMPMVDLDLIVDRPFLFWISETRTEAPLFLGIVTDPTA
jgi:serpin B